MNSQLLWHKLSKNSKASETHTAADGSKPGKELGRGEQYKPTVMGNAVCSRHYSKATPKSIIQEQNNRTVRGKRACLLVFVKNGSWVKKNNYVLLNIIPEINF